MTIFDWKKDKDFVLANGVSIDEEGRQVLSSGKNKINEYLAKHLPQVRVRENEFKNCVFRNFSNIVVEDIAFCNCVFENCEEINVQDGGAADCTFEDCGKITLQKCNASRCNFKKINSLFAVSGMFSDSVFSKLKSDSNNILAFESIVMRDCTFDDIELRNDSWLCSVDGRCWIIYCSFNNCRTSRKDLKLFHGEENGKEISQSFVVSEDRCKGLDIISLLDE